MIKHIGRFITRFGIAFGIAAVLVNLLLATQLNAAQVIPELWNRNSTHTYLIPRDNSSSVTPDIGAAGDRVPKGWFDDLDTTLLTLGGAVTGDLHVNDDSEVTFGNTFAAPDVRLGWNTAQTVDALYLGLSTAQNTFIIGELGDIAFDFAHGASAYPRVFFHSANQNTTQWLSMGHDGTDGVITTGAGQLNLDSAAGIVAIPGAVGTGTAKRFLVRSAANGTSGFELGEGNISTFYFRAMHTEDQGLLAVSTQVGNQIVLTTNTNVAKDHDHVSQTNPTWFIHSATDPDTDNTEWLSLTHDTSNAVIGTGKGGLVFGQGTKNDGYVTRRPAEVQTTNATQTTLDTITLLDENTYHIDAWVIGVQSTGANRASYSISATVYRTAAGVATIQGAVTTYHTAESNAAWDATFTVSGNDVRVSITGVAGATVEWGTAMRYMNMSN